MPLEHSSSPGAFKRNVSTLMGEVGQSPHVQSRKQALAIAYATQRRGNRRADGGDVAPPNALTGEPTNPESIAGQEARGAEGWAQGSAPGGFEPGSAGWWSEALPVSPAPAMPATPAAAAAPAASATPGAQDSLAAFYQSTINQIPPEFADYRHGVGTQLASLYYNQRGAWPALNFAEGGEVGGLVNHDQDPDLPPAQDHAQMIPMMQTPRGYRDPAYIGVIQRLLEGQKRLNAMNPVQREQLRRYWLGGLIRRMYGGSV